MEISTFTSYLGDYILAEIPACKRSLFFEGNYRRFLSLPSILFSIPYHSRSSSLKLGRSSILVAYKFQDKIYLPSLPNTCDTCAICLGDNDDLFDLNHFLSDTKEELAKKIISYYWSSEFNYDLNGAKEIYNPNLYKNSSNNSLKQYNLKCEKYENPQDWNGSVLGSYDDWAKKTKENPEWVPGPEEMFELKKGFWDYFNY